MADYSFLEYIKFAFGDIYVSPSPPPFNYFFWTIPIELRGSFVVFAIATCLPFIKYRSVVLAVATVYAGVFFDYWITLFIFGILLGQLRSDGVFRWMHARIWTRILAGLGVLASLLIPYILMNVRGYFMKDPLYSCLVTFMVYASRDTVSFMRNPLSVFLGHISFCLYLLHSITLRTLFAALMQVCYDNGWVIDEAAKAWITLCTCLASIIGAYLMYLVEARYLDALDRASKWLLVNQIKKPSAPAPIPPNAV